MLKHSLIAFIVCFVLFACKENNPNNDGAGSDSFRKVTDIPLDTANQKHGTTLDSLQGTWINTLDKNAFLTIKFHTHLEIYKDGNSIDTSVAEFYLVDSCETNMSKLDIRKTNGQCMILTMADNPVSTLCYKIDYIDDKHLVLLFNGKTLGYDKK